MNTKPEKPLPSLLNVKHYFYHLHDVECNQKYAKNLPYSFHLSAVAAQAELFQHHIPNNPVLNIATWVGIYGHDSIEDARLTFNNIVEEFGLFAAEIIFLCTEDKGRKRAERKAVGWYEELMVNDLAVFVKLCDIIANVKFSILTNSDMFSKYKSEYHGKVKPLLYTKKYKDMFEHLDYLFGI